MVWRYSRSARCKKTFEGTKRVSSKKIVSIGKKNKIRQTVGRNVEYRMSEQGKCSVLPWGIGSANGSSEKYQSHAREDLQEKHGRSQCEKLPRLRRRQCGVRTVEVRTQRKRDRGDSRPPRGTLSSRAALR